MTYNNTELLNICAQVLGFPIGPNTYNIVDQLGDLVVVHHHRSSDPEYRWIRGVVIDTKNKVLITKSTLGTIENMDMRTFKSTKKDIKTVYYGVEGMNIKIFKYCGTTYYTTNRRIYTNDTKDTNIQQVINIVEKSKSKLFGNVDTSVCLHDFILVNRNTNLLSNKHVPEDGYLVYLGSTKTTKEPDTEDIKINVYEKYKIDDKEYCIDTVYINENDEYKPVSGIYWNKVAGTNMDTIIKCLKRTKEFCLVTYKKDDKLVTCKISDYQYLHRESIYGFTNNIVLKFISLCKDIPYVNKKGPKTPLARYFKKYQYYHYTDKETVLNIMNNGGLFKLKLLKDNKRPWDMHFNTNTIHETLLLNTWINLYMSMPQRSRHLAIPLYDLYNKIIDNVYQLCRKYVNQGSASITQYSNIVDNIEHIVKVTEENLPKYVKFSDDLERDKVIMNRLKTTIMHYTSAKIVHNIAEELKVIN